MSTEKKHEITVRVYYEDTDCGNVVYYANYLRYMERGRTELFRAFGIDLSVYHGQGFVFAVAEASVKYRRSARYNDLLTVVTSVTEVTPASMTFHSDILRDGTLLASGDVKAACVKLSNGRPARLPADMFQAIRL